MLRRDFLKLGTASAAWPLLQGKMGQAFALAPLGMARESAIGDRILVIIRLDGGNDGLATVLPLDQYDKLAKARANVLIPAAKGLKLNDTMALHPNCVGMHKLFMEGKLSVVQGVGYPNHNQSHFRSTDIFFTASDSNVVLESGWLGRYLDSMYPGFPEGYPETELPDPPSLQIGSVLSTLLIGGEGPIGMTVANPSSIYTLMPDGFDTAPATPAGHELSFIRNMAMQTQKYGESIKKAMATSTTKSTLWPTGKNGLADQLKAVARLIAGGSRTPVYVCSIGGFDTHAGQVDIADMLGGRHGSLMTQLSEATTAFVDEIKLAGMEDRVLGLTVSEFGRRILSNASYGTDHGTTSCLFLFGKPVAGGVVGKNPVIPDTVTVKDNLPMQYDFRRIYASVLKGHMGLSNADAAKVLLKDFETLPVLASSLRDPGRRQALAPLRAYRNLQGTGVEVSLTLSQPTAVRASVIDAGGRVLGSPWSGELGSGSHRIAMAANLPRSGMAYVRWEMPEGVQVAPLMAAP